MVKILVEHTEEKIIRELPTGLLRWYPFVKRSRTLYIGTGDDAISCMLRKDKELDLTAVAIPMLQHMDEKPEFKYVVCVAEIEMSDNPEKMLGIIRKKLVPEGILLLGMNNRMGIRYFCGDRDLYSGRCFDSIDEYSQPYCANEGSFGRMYSKNEIRGMLHRSGFTVAKFHSVLSDLKNPMYLYAEGFYPNEDLSNRVFPTYNSPETVFADELQIYRTLIGNKLFHEMANAYLIECTALGTLSDTLHVTCSLERGRSEALITVIHDNGIVTKQAAYPEGEWKLSRLVENGEKLKERGIKVIDGKLENGIYTMPFIEGKNGQLFLRELLETDKERFINEMDHFRDLIIQSSELHEGKFADSETDTGGHASERMQGDGLPAMLLDEGMFEMVPLNSFYVDGEFVFYDQEFCFHDLPVNIVIARMIASFYVGSPGLQKILPRDELFKRYGILEDRLRWQEPEWEFLAKLRNQDILADYHKSVRADEGIIAANRERMNFSAEDYWKIFVDIFRECNGKKLVIFGAGKYARRYIEKYSKDYEIYAVVDNNKDLWGKHIEGLQNIRIQSPETLGELRKNELKIIICMREYMAVISQLKAMGVTDYAVYDPRKRYPEPERRMSIFAGRDADSMEKEDSTADACHRGNGFEKKPYHIGYVAGAFDMFHIGHLNLLRRAKERCDYLIAGVMSDERMFDLKKKHAVIPCNERMQVVAGCRYVDQVEELPADRAGIMDAYNMFHFDCMFSGDDHADNPGWLAERERLREHGSDIVFVPYTKEQSSTEIREKMKR